MSFAVAALVGFWAFFSFAFAAAGGLFRSRELPATRHPRRVQITDLETEAPSPFM